MNKCQKCNKPVELGDGEVVEVISSFLTAERIEHLLQFKVADRETSVVLCKKCYLAFLEPHIKAIGG